MTEEMRTLLNEIIVKHNALNDLLPASGQTYGSADYILSLAHTEGKVRAYKDIIDTIRAKNK